MRRYFYSLVIILFSGAISITAGAATITAQVSGSWSNPATWNCYCVPGASDHIMIPKGITVEILRPVKLAPGRDIVISVAGTISLINGSLQLDETDWITILPGGRISGEGMGGMIFYGVTRIAIEPGAYIAGPAAVHGDEPVRIEGPQGRINEKRAVRRI